ncbi:MAG: pilus assembly protein [Methylocystis sp.]|nr:pilus assembly protein [Methylocystis sp.]
MAGFRRRTPDDGGRNVCLPPSVLGLLSSVRGVAAIEFAILAPTLALLMISAVDFSLGINRKMQVQNAARAGMEWAIRQQPSVPINATAIASAVTNATSYTGISASPAPNQFCGCASSTAITSISCSSTCSGGSSPGTYVAVSAQATYTTLLPYPGIATSFNFTAKSTVRLQ